MNTVLRQSGLRFVVYLDDHEPSHVHVIGAGRMKIALEGPDGQPHVLSVEGMSFVDARRAFRAVKKNQAMLLAKWREIHG